MLEVQVWLINVPVLFVLANPPEIAMFSEAVQLKVTPTPLTVVLAEIMLNIGSLCSFPHQTFQLLSSTINPD